MTQAEIHILIRHTLDELNVDHSHWKPDRLREFCSEAAGDIATKLPAAAMPLLQADWIKNLVIGTQIYDLPDPKDYVQIIGVWCNYYTPTKPMEWYQAKPLNHQNVDVILKNPFYEPSKTSPFMLIFNGQVTVWPSPDRSVPGGLKVPYIKPHPRFSDDPAEEPLLPSNSHPWIAEYAVYKCLFEDNDERNTTIYQAYQNHFPKPGETQ